MDYEDQYCHSSSIEADVPAARAFAYMADGVKQGEWTLGSWNRRKLGDNLFAGTSLFTGEEIFVQIDTEPHHLLVSYSVGPAPDRLLPFIWARIVDGPDIGRPSGTCVITLLNWRLADDSDSLWLRVCLSLKTEVFIIRGLLERRKVTPADRGEPT
jgi:hypothetical protein